MLRHLALVALFTSSAALAQEPSPTITGTRDGVSFAYQSAVRDNGHIEITGRMLDTDDPFHLVVRPNGRVSGLVGGTPVEFEIADEARDRVFESLRADQKPTAVARVSALSVSDQR